MTSSSPSTPTTRTSLSTSSTAATTTTSTHDHARITVKLRPRAPHFHALLDANGFNPLLALIVRGRQTLAFIRDHVARKWSVADAAAGTRRRVPANDVEFHLKPGTDDAVPLPYVTSMADLARDGANSRTVVELYYSWSLKLTPALPPATVSASAATTTSAAAPINVIPDENSKRRRIRSPSASPARAASTRIEPPPTLSAISSPQPQRAFAHLFGDPLQQTVPLRQPHLPASLSLLKRPARQALLSDDSRDMPLLGGTSSGGAQAQMFQDNHDDLDLLSGHSRHGPFSTSGGRW
jgi:hypothetical protein